MFWQHKVVKVIPLQVVEKPKILCGQVLGYHKSPCLRHWLKSIEMNADFVTGITGNIEYLPLTDCSNDTFWREILLHKSMETINLSCEEITKERKLILP